MKTLTISNFPPASYACNEAVNTLCTNLSFAGEDVKIIMLTSCHASEGKSFLSMNVLRNMAKLGKTVVMVDADLRRSHIRSKYGLRFENEEDHPGLSHFLAGMADADQVIYSTDIEGAYIVPTGRELSNPLPLLASKRFEGLLKHLAQSVDYVIVDAPPVNVVIDAAEIAKSCDGTLLVVDYNTVRRNELIDAKKQLEQTGCPILGTVLNRVEYNSYVSRKYYYKYNYRYKYDYYYAKSDKDGKKKHSGKKEEK